MRATALVLFVGLVAPVAGAQADCMNNASDFLSEKVRVVHDFQLVPYRPTPGRPLEPGTHPKDQNYQNDLAAMHAAAPDWFRRALCDEKLTRIMLDESNQAGTNPGGWWFNERAGQGEGKNNYVGISTQLWASTHPLTTSETIILQTLLQLEIVNPANTPRYVSAASDTWTSALLSVLAHEIGHSIFHNNCEVAIDPPEACAAFTEGEVGSWIDTGERPEFHGFGRPFVGSRLKAEAGKK